MKAIVYTTYGPPDVWRLQEVPKPEPKEGGVLIRIHSSAVTRTDCEMREANRKSGAMVSAISRLVSGVRKPRQPILGKDLAGVVTEVVPGVGEFKVGDRVFGSAGFRFGAFAEYVALPESSRIAAMPESMSFDEGAAICDGGLYALWPLKLARIQAGESVLVYGSSGAIGTAAVQIAKSMGAEVTAVCTAKNLPLMAHLGADHAIDYESEDFTKNGRTYDVIMDAVGKFSFSRSKDSLSPGGRFLATDHLGNLFLHFWTSRAGSRKVIFSIPPRATKQDVQWFKELFEAGRYCAVIDRTYPMEDIAEAGRYVESGQKTGNVILKIAATPG